MECIGTVDALCRYPVKSMGGQEVDEAFVGFGGVMGDRAYAFLPQQDARRGFPWYTARQQESLLRYRPRYRHDAASRLPIDIDISLAIPPGASPIYPDHDAFGLDVALPDGPNLAVDFDELRTDLESHVGRLLKLRHSAERSLADCRPLSLFGNATARALGQAMGRRIDRRRFRANFYAEWHDDQPFREDGLVGRTLQLGNHLRIAVLERDPRCKMITLDPDTGEMDASILRHVAKTHDSKVGVYAAVLIEGIVRKGDPIGLV